MCKIILAINKNKKNKNIISKLIDFNIDELKKEEDGYSVFRNNKSYFYPNKKDYEDDKIKKNLKYNNEEIFIVHFRTSTGGSSGIEGLHLKKIKNFVFAHNGVVAGLWNVKNKSDSFYFFKKLIKKNKKIDSGVIKKYSQKYNFQGKGVLYNLKTKELHLFLNAMGFFYVLDQAIIFSSFELKLKKKIIKVKNVLGFEWQENTGEEEKIQGILHQERTSGAYFKFKDGVLKERKDFEVNDQNYNFYYRYNNKYKLFSGYDFDK